ncbi:Zinc finger and BTB domain-containing protein 8B-like [Homarus americanus]|uniref:Zinc finger and BTB domain-containing protein 8B-like n=1 Tax=Homarus americanus TaxID=6706 RepID=A0A8J5NE13_HOMAM|nr:Zinc finger and BTB domain-containing protein 8B-like [Homarus americanus]
MSETSSSGPTRPPPPLCPLLQEDEDYDAWVLAGGRLFRAHTSVLASHSAYLRGAAVGAAGGGGSSSSSGQRDVRLLLPHVPPAGFAAVLTYMYTGRLPLTPSTLYEVLLAGHLLQMAGVVSLCQALLTTTTTTTTTTSSLGLSDVPPALSVWRGLARLVPPPQHAAAASSSLPTTIVRPTPTRPRPPHHPLNPPQDLTRETETMEEGVGGEERRNTAQRSDENRSPDANPRYPHKTALDDGGQVSTGAVVIDPLLGHDDSETETEINVDDIDSCDDNSSRAQTGGSPLGAPERNGLANILRLRAAGDAQRNALAASPPMPNNQVSRTYHCVYCNHTFKSHYCYQKHMRRHINPITVEVDKQQGTSSSSPRTVETSLSDGGSQAGMRERVGESSNSGANSSIINESIKSGSVSPFSGRTVSPAPSEGLKILDLNVQYFPCKTCGSKFPSYYFVHKHRRLCHQEEESSSFNKKSNNNPTPSTSTSTTPTPTPVNTPASTPTITTTAA